MHITMENNTEAVLQMSIHDLLSRAGVFHFSIPNERSNQKTMSKLKKMGLAPGMPDLCILENGTIYFIEFKSEKGKLSDKQKMLHRILKEKGYQVAAAYSFEEAYKILNEWGFV